MSEDFSHRKEEYLTLRKEVEGMLAELSSLEKNAVLGIAAVYSWVTTQAIEHHTVADFYRIVAFGTPVFIAFFCALRAYAINQHFGTTSDYMMKLEESTKRTDADFIGWEHFFRDHDNRGTQTRMRIAYWVCLVVATFAVWVVSWCQH
jgi:hypothetical protein